MHSLSTHVHRFDDLTHAFRMETITFVDHQQFLSAGKAWRRGGTRPFQGLDKVRLRMEPVAYWKVGLIGTGLPHLFSAF